MQQCFAISMGTYPPASRANRDAGKRGNYEVGGPDGVFGTHDSSASSGSHARLRQGDRMIRCLQRQPRAVEIRRPQLERRGYLQRATFR